MGNVLEEMQAILDGRASAEDLYLAHYGVGHLDGGNSGRYPWGSGEDAYQHEEYRDFKDRVDKMRKEKFEWTDPETGKHYTGDLAIARYCGLKSTTELREELTICTNERRARQVAIAKNYANKGMGASAIGREMGISEGTVRSLLNPEREAKMNEAKNAADFLRERVNATEHGMVDVGDAAELQLGISKERLNTALYMLQKEGYNVYSGGIPQATNPGKQTTQKVLTTPGHAHKDIYEYDKVSTIMDYKSPDGGKTFKKSFIYPESMDSKRLMIRYSEDGGELRDGVVELRRGVDDLSLGDARYSQVRILVDGTHYIKGMAVYGKDEDFPDGVDVIFNTNKGKNKTKMEVLKPIKDDPDNPFGAAIKENGGQSYYIGKDGKEHLSLINKRSDQGDWTEWKDTLPSQFLSKQSEKMAEQQLNLARADKREEYDSIMSLTNPTIKKYYLNKFAEECDSAAVDLKAAALPGQKYHVIIPLNSLKDNEIYAPGYPEGTKLALVRYPHGGTFEIPILTVTHKNKDGQHYIGQDSIDAVGITKKVADQLSGADFDGDTVMCIPTHDSKGRVKISNRAPLKELEGFDPKHAYPEVPGMKYMKDESRGTDSTQSEMGRISNLITDMTLGGATDDELARAVKHSMVVIDAGKHKLNYQQSYEDNKIEELRIKYQGKKDGGAATIISKAKGEYTVDKRQGQPKINQKDKAWYDPTKPEGSLIYKKADDLYYPVRRTDKEKGTVTLSTVDGKKVTYSYLDKDEKSKYDPIKVVDKNGNVKFTNADGSLEYKFKTKTQASTKMAEADDAYNLVSPNKWDMEILYAEYANDMKRLANEARMSLVNTPSLQYNKEANKLYSAEVKSLDDKLKRAELNKLKEREAQRRSAHEVASKQRSYQDSTGKSMGGKDIRKANQQAITKYRSEVGSETRGERSIKITDNEWKAIQAGAITNSKLEKILNNSDPDSLRERAIPKDQKALSSAKISKMKAMQASNYSIADIAKACGVSTSTVNKYLKGVV
ncbi:MAG: hypothetical protein KBT20_06280 [Bacteroidales bacterium]|nr:hypothetical protein [Candidatus Liminaster caballi]